MDQADVDQNERVPFWALLIGIDRYCAPGVRDLRGCCNDVAAMRAFLTNNLGVPVSQIKTLLDAEATRAGILQALHALIEHTAIERNDQIIIHFSGHGALMRPPTAWQAAAYVQSLVPHDGYCEGVHNLPDRTFGALLDQLAAKFGPNITVILDACHSGSGTRDSGAEGAPRVRQVDPDPRVPPDTLDQSLLGGGALRRGSKSGWLDASMPYVLVAGCRDGELANEYRAPEATGEAWNGALTFFTLKLLRELAGGSSSSYTYLDLHERVAAYVNTLYPQQMPQCEGEGRSRAVFGGHKIERDPWILVDQVHGDQITLRAGLLLGCGPGAVVHLFPADPGLRRHADAPATPLAVAEILVATATTSRALLREITGQVVPLARGLLAAPVFGGERQRVLMRTMDATSEPGINALTLALARPGTGGGLLLHQRDPDAAFDLCVVGENGTLGIYSSEGSLLVQPILYTGQSSEIDRVLSALQSIARFRGLQMLGSHHEAGELAGKLKLRLRRYTLDAGTVRAEPLTSEPSDLTLDFRAEHPDDSRFVVDIINSSETPLYPELFVLNPDFSIVQLYPHQGLQSAIQHKDGVDGQISLGIDPKTLPLRVGLPPEWNSCRDYLKLIATTTYAGLEKLAQTALAVPSPPAVPSSQRGALQTNSALGQLLDSAVSGQRFGGVSGIGNNDIWATASLAFTVVRRGSTVALKAGSEQVPLENGLLLTKPAAFVGNARLVSDGGAQRGADGPPPPAAFEHSDAFVPAVAAGTRGVIASALALDLELDPLARELITPEQPLCISVPAGSVGADGPLIAVLFDGEEYLFVGSDAAQAGTLRVEALPMAAGDADATRGTFNTLRLFLYRKLGRFTDLIGLRRGLLHDGVVSYEHVTPAQFKAGESVAVVVHGFNSDTRWMVRDVAPFLREQVFPYNHVLAFDYESFGTGIEATAELLAQALTHSCGFGEHDQMRVDLYAHSMGSLVARCAIELFGAHSYVERLVMAGPPNRGSTLASSGRGLAYLATAMLNELGKIPPLGLLRWTLEEFQKQGLGMADLEVDSALLRKLNGLKQPNSTHYLVLAGDFGAEPEHNRLERLADKMLKQGTTALFGEANDLVVGRSSQHGVRHEAYPLLHVAPLRCGHFSYFHDPAGRAEIRRWVAASASAAQPEMPTSI